MLIGYATSAYASVVLDYGSGLKFEFDTPTVVGGHQYYFDSIEYQSEKLTTVQYYLTSIDAIY